MSRFSFYLGLSLGLLWFASGQQAEATYLYSGGTYVQDFDTLPMQGFTKTLTGKGPHALSTAFEVSGLDGWYGANPGGSSTSTEFRAHNGSLSGSTGRGILSLGINDSQERALGSLSTSNQICSFGLVLQNITGLLIDDVDISFVGEQWRRGNVTTPNTLTFAWLVSSTPVNIDASGFTDVSALLFTSPNTQSSPTEVALDGNAVGNQTSISGSLSGLNWAPNAYLVLRWSGVDLSGQDDALAIDTFRFTGHPIPEPSMMLLASLALLSLAAYARRKQS